MLLIPCPWCGPRAQTEFHYGGDASLRRPALSTARTPADPALVDYVYLRDNPKGLHQEHWQHAAGCGQWLVVARDTRSHAILGSAPPGGDPLSPPGTDDPAA